MRTDCNTQGGRGSTVSIRLAILVIALAAVSVSAQTGQTLLRDPCSTGEPQARVNACSQLLQRSTLDPKARVGALVSRGDARFALEELDLAMRDYQAALDIDANSALALRSRAIARYRRGQNAEALADLTHAISIAPDDLESLRIRAAVRAEMGDAVHAIEDFSKILDVSPGDLAAREGRALALASTGEHARAVQDFNRILERQPRARVARAARAFSLFQLRRYPLAIADWDQLLAADPAQLALVYCRGAAKVLSGDQSGRAEMEGVRQQKPEVAATEAAACGTLRD